MLRRPPAMYAIAFGLKRAFHGFLSLTRGPLRKLGITAARLDMLKAIDSFGSLGCDQRELRKQLGVTAATISRMLRSLEDLAYVTRERSFADGRRRIVYVTEVGRFVLRRAFAKLQRHVELAFDCALAGHEWWNESSCLLRTDCTETHLRNVRRSFGDRATLYYPWHPDD